MSGILLCFTLVLLVFALAWLALSLRIVPEHARLVVFRLGRMVGARGPGLIFLMPLVDRGVSVDLRERVETIHAAQFLLHDRSTLQMDVIYSYQTVDPVAAVLNVADADNALRQLVLTTLQALLAEESAGDVLMGRTRFAEEAAMRVRAHVELWGIAVHSIELGKIER